MENCIFCKIISGTIPSKKVYEDEEILAFEDINPAAPVHIIIIPKKHIVSFNEIITEDAKLHSDILIKISTIAKNIGIAEEGYRVVTNCGHNGGQTVQHLHYHLLGGRSLNWPPG